MDNQSLSSVDLWTGYEKFVLFLLLKRRNNMVLFFAEAMVRPSRTWNACAHLSILLERWNNVILFFAEAMVRPRRAQEACAFHLSILLKRCSHLIQLSVGARMENWTDAITSLLYPALVSIK